MLKAKLTRDEYNKFATEKKMKLVEDPRIETVNYTYIPNYLALDLHQRSISLCATVDCTIQDAKALDNLIAYHKHCLEDLIKIKET